MAVKQYVESTRVALRKLFFYWMKNTMDFRINQYLICLAKAVHHPILSVYRWGYYAYRWRLGLKIYLEN